MSSVTVANVPSISLPNEVQKLSVQLIDIPRLNRYIKQAPSYQENRKIDCWEECISHIIEIYNQKFHHFELQVPTFVADSFHCCIYKQSKKSEPRINKVINSIVSGKKLSKKSDTNFILFFFRYQPLEAFAVTSGPSWQVVRPCINYQFTTKVALKILDPHRITKITRRCLVGSNVQETLISPSGHELCKTSNLYYLVESFTAAIKPGASILSCFNNNNLRSPKNITVSTGLLRFDKEMPLEIYPTLLKLFSFYYNDHPSYAYKNAQWVPEIADPEFEFLKFLEEEYVLTPVLNKLLIRKVLLSRGVRGSGKVQFYHKYLQDFLEGHSFQIQLGPYQRYHPLSDHAPSLDTVVSYIHQVFPALFNLAENPSEYEVTPRLDFLEALFNQGALRFNTKDKEIKEPLINYLEGEVRSEGISYFKVRGMWYRIHADFHLLLQQDFKQLLGSLLISPQNDPQGQLPLRWNEAPQSTSRSNKEEENYNCLYSYTNFRINQSIHPSFGLTPFGPDNGYLVFDRVLPFNIEPCDIVKYTPTTTYLIHVKKKFGKDTRDVCSQIINAARHFRSASLHQSQGFLDQLWKRGVDGGKTSRAQLITQLVHLGREKFFHIFSERRLIFVYAYVPTPSLRKESQLPVFLTPTNFENIQGVTMTAPALFNQLIHLGYLDSQGRITTKFYCTTEGAFITEFPNAFYKYVKEEIYKRLSSYRSQSKSTLAKLDLIHLAKEIRELGFDLRICEIELG